MTIERKNNPELTEKISFKPTKNGFHFNISVADINSTEQYLADGKFLEKVSKQVYFRRNHMRVFYRHLIKKLEQNNIRDYWISVKPTLQASKHNSINEKNYLYLHIYELNFRINIFMRHSDLNRLKLSDYNFYLWLNGRSA